MQSTSALPALTTTGSSTTTKADKGSGSQSVVDKYSSYLKYRVSSDYAPGKPIFSAFLEGDGSNLFGGLLNKVCWLEISKKYLSARDIIHLSGTNRGFYNLLRPTSMFEAKLDATYGLLPVLCQAYDKLMSSELMAEDIRVRPIESARDMFKEHAVLVIRKSQGYVDNIPGLGSIDNYFALATAENIDFAEWLAYVLVHQFSEDLSALRLDVDMSIAGSIFPTSDGPSGWELEIVNDLNDGKYDEIQNDFMIYLVGLIILDMFYSGLIRAKKEPIT